MRDYRASACTSNKLMWQERHLPHSDLSLCLHSAASCVVLCSVPPKLTLNKLNLNFSICMLCSSKWVAAVQTDCGQCWLCSCYPFDECCCRCGHYLPSCGAYWSGPLQSSTCTGLLSPPLVTINDSETAAAKMSSQETEYLHFLFYWRWRTCGEQ